MKIAVASDHGGFALKREILKFLSGLKVPADDLGCDNEKSVDYPDYALAVARKVSNNEVDAGILVCGTGIGMAMAANKVRGIRAAVVYSEFTARMAKEHNNANIICMGGRTTSSELACKMVEIWLDAGFGGDRHQGRIDKISEIEKRGA